MYIHEQADWPKLHWNSEALTGLLAEVRHRQGRLLGQMQALGFGLQEEAVLRTLTEDVVKSSAIEGQELDPAAVRSSIARRLGMDVGGLKPADRDVEGVVEMMLDATRNYDKKLTEERLFGWHASLFPTGRSGMRRITVGGWRNDSDGPMQVVSGPVGKEKVHFEAPKAPRLAKEMTEFLDWFNQRPGGRSGPQGRHRASVVRDNSSVRRRQRAHRARDCRSVPRPLGKKFAALLQHVGADPAGAQGILRPAGTHAKRRDGHNGMADMVPGMPRPRD